MAQRKLWLANRVLMACTTAMLLMACRAEEPVLIGMTLVYECEGPEIIVWKFELEGMRATSPGALNCGPKGGAQMAFMPGDSKSAPPRYADIEWWIHPDKERRFTQRVDLTDIVTPALIKRVQDKRQTTQLRLIMRFKGDQLDVEANAYKWR